MHETLIRIGITEYSNATQSVEERKKTFILFFFFVKTRASTISNRNFATNAFFNYFSFIRKLHTDGSIFEIESTNSSKDESILLSIYRICQNSITFRTVYVRQISKICAPTNVMRLFEYISCREDSLFFLLFTTYFDSANSTITRFYRMYSSDHKQVKKQKFPPHNFHLEDA